MGGFVPVGTNNGRGGKTATVVDVFGWFYWLDSHGNGAKLMHIASRPGGRSHSDAQCQPGGHCKKRYAAASLDKGHASKLKCAMMEQLGKLDNWDWVEKLGNPVASPILGGNLSFVQGEQRRVGVGVKQAPTLAAVQLRGLVRDMPRRARTLPTAAEHIAMIRDVAIFCVAFHTMTRGFELSVAVGSQVLQMAGGKGFIFNFCLERRCEAPPKRWW